MIIKESIFTRVSQMDALAGIFNVYACLYMISPAIAKICLHQRNFDNISITNNGHHRSSSMFFQQFSK